MEFKTKISFSTNPSKDEIIVALKELWMASASQRSKIMVTFAKDVKVITTIRKSVSTSNIGLYFFISNRENLCYSNRKNFKRGYLLSSDFVENIRCLEVVLPEVLTDSERVLKVNSFLDKFHSSLWTNIQEELLANPQIFKEKYYDNFETVYLTRWFSAFQLEELTDAILKRRGIRLYAGGSKRDIKLTTELGEDGIYRGWVSSEYSGCANGQYFVVISDKLAAFSEYD